MKKNSLLFIALLFTSKFYSQEVDLLNMVSDSVVKKEKEYVSSAFKSTRNINFHTTEVLPQRSLDFRISHRFSTLDGKGYNAWGIDGPANLMLSLEYSYNGKCMIGIQRSFLEKMGALFFKTKIFRQAKGGGSPVSVTFFTGAYNTFEKDPFLGLPHKFYNLNTDRISYVNQLMVTRKWNSWLSTQVGFAYVHYNLVGAANGLAINDCMVGTGLVRLKYTSRQALIVEYGYRLSTDYGSINPVTNKPVTYYNTFGAGWEMETGGHVFQVFVTNSFGILENQFLTRTTSDIATDGLRIGFNIMRVFSVGGKRGSW